MKRSYPIVCPSCDGRGWIPTPYAVSSEATIVCPACTGNKTIICVEEDDIRYSIEREKP